MFLLDSTGLRAVYNPEKCFNGPLGVALEQAPKKSYNWNYFCLSKDKDISKERDLQHHLGFMDEETETMGAKWFRIEPGFLIPSSKNYNGLLLVENSNQLNQHFLTMYQALCCILQM